MSNVVLFLFGNLSLASFKQRETNYGYIEISCFSLSLYRNEPYFNVKLIRRGGIRFHTKNLFSNRIIAAR